MSEPFSPYDALIARLAGVERRGRQLAVNGHAFACLLADGRLALRLPEEARAYLMDRYAAEACDEDFVVVPAALASDAEALKGCFRASHGYVSELAS